MENPHDTVVILSTAPPDRAAAIAEALVRERLVACVNILPVRSCYRWEGEICNDDEHLLVMKTVRGKADAVTAAVKRMHGYDLPEVIVLPVIGGYPPYLAWVAGETAVR